MFLMVLSNLCKSNFTEIFECYVPYTHTINFNERTTDSQCVHTLTPKIKVSCPSQQSCPLFLFESKKACCSLVLEWLCSLLGTHLNQLLLLLLLLLVGCCCLPLPPCFFVVVVVVVVVVSAALCGGGCSESAPHDQRRQL